MAWLELSIVVAAQTQPTLEAALEGLGAVSVTLADADAATPDERAIFEPGVGAMPLWTHTRVQALFSGQTDRAQLLNALTAVLPAISPTAVQWKEVADQDWTRAWMDRFRPMRFGRRLWVYPWTIEPPDDAELTVVRLDPGLAFGTGTHPTTALCLEWLDGLQLAGQRVIDYGCGSGVLAVAALKLGAATATGIDNDPQALTASRSNADRNGVGGHLQLFAPVKAPTDPADVVIANILAGPLIELAPQLAHLCRPGAAFALSGILRSQRDEVSARYAPWFDELIATEREDWVRISGRRRTPHPA